ncbi:MAG: hypothetical protein RSD39_00830, partial [Oscillospiraceae bacterium]
GSETTVGVQVYDYDPANLAGSVSFEVPLYITLAITKATPTGCKVIAPTTTNEMAYSIKNTAVAGGTPIAVKSMTVQQAPAATWTLVNGLPTGANVLQLKLGAAAMQVTLPAVSNATPVPVSDAGFVNNTKPLAGAVIAANASLVLDVLPTIDTAQNYPAAAAAAQFVLKYTLNPVGANGEYLTANSVNSYIGNDRTKAGF